jgi:hypothetical protein
LKLPRQVQLAGVKVGVLPCQPEQLALAQTEDEDQDVGGVERIDIVTGRLEEPPSLLAGPGLTPSSSVGRELHGRGHVAGDQTVGDGLRQDRSQDSAKVCHGGR